MSDLEDNAKTKLDGDDFMNDEDHDQAKDRSTAKPEDSNGNDNDGDNQEAEKNDEEKNEKSKDDDKPSGRDDDEVRFRRCFVGNLAFKTSWQQLKDYMRKAGKVTRVDIFEDKNGQSKGFGLVEFSSAEEAEKAIKELNQTSLDGRQIFVRKDDVKQANNSQRDRRPPRRDSPRRRGSSSRSNDKDRRRSRRQRSRSRSSSRSRSNSRRRHRRSERENKDRRRDRSRDRERRKSRSKDRRSPERKSKGSQVIVKNMPWSVTWQQLKDAFKGYGAVIRAEVPQDESGRSKGYGYVKFEREKDAMKSIDEMDGASFNGRTISVKISDE